MPHKHYEAQNWSLDQKKGVLYLAKAFCNRWWVDTLDCSKSFYRQRIEMDFEDVLAKLNKECSFHIVHRDTVEEYLEFGFSTSGRSPSYFLWIIVDMKYKPVLVDPLFS